MKRSRPSSTAFPVAVAALLCVVALAGCARDAADWSAAQDADTRESYEAFLAKHPASEFASQAKQRAAQLEEERDWATATQADTAAAYGAFVGRYPDGKWTQEARIRIENFNVMAASAPERPADAVVSTAPAAPATVAAATVPPAAVAPPATTAARPAVPPPDQRPPVAGAARVQLGAFSSQARADAEWTRLRGRFTALQALEPQVATAQTAAGRLFRLQAGVANEAAGKSLCAQLQAEGQGCLIVPAR